MAERDVDPRVLEGVDDSKRDSLKKMVKGTAFAAPVVASFSLDGLLNAAQAQVNGYASNQTF